VGAAPAKLHGCVLLPSSCLGKFMLYVLYEKKRQDKDFESEILLKEEE
jgi:hypothetical protein